MRARATFGAAAAVLAALVSAAGGATAAYARPARSPNTFDGTCKLSGELAFEQPLGNLPRAITFTDEAAGTCTGALNGMPVQDAPVVNHVRGSATASCLAGRSLSHDTLVFPRGIAIHLISDATFGLTQGVSHTTGAVSGDSLVHVNFLPYTDQSTLAACQADALRSARYDLVARTITPLTG